MTRLLPLPLAIATMVGCAAYQPTDPDYAFHETFERGRAHQDTSCDACHILAASDQRVRQGLDIPPPDQKDWVTEVSGACQHCHPFVAELGEIPPDQDCYNPLSPVYEHEYCRFVNYHGNNRPATCTDSGCHSIEHTTFGFFSQPIDTDDTDAPTPPLNPHLEAPLVDIFPIEGGHVGLACNNAACHNAGEEALAAGKSEYCGSCHGRVRDTAPDGAAHYPPQRPGWTEERERDCLACHAKIEVGGDIVYPTSWGTDPTYDATYPRNHAFLVPHNTVEEWGVTPLVPRLEPAWKRQCWSCHNDWSVSQPTNPTDTQNGTSQDSLPPNIYMELGATEQANCTDGCHGTINGVPTDDHKPGQSNNNCLGSCHSTAGPDDIATDDNP